MTTTTRRQGLPTFYSLIASQPVESNIKNNKLRENCKVRIDRGVRYSAGLDRWERQLGKDIKIYFDY